MKNTMKDPTHSPAQGSPIIAYSF